MHRGYIKIWRKIEDSWIIQDPAALWLWIKLLLKANHVDTSFMFNGKSLTLKRGQLITGRKSLVDKHKISESKVYRLLKCFENEHLIEQQKTNLYTIISIVSYDTYNITEQDIEQPVNNQRTTSEQPVNTSKELIRTNKNKKNNILSIQQARSFEVTWSIYPRKLGKPQAFSKYCKTVLTEEQAKQCKRAVENYLAEIEDKGTEEKFIKHGSTFFSMWQDYYALKPFEADQQEEISHQEMK